MNLYKDIDLNMRHLENSFTDCGDLVKRKIPVSGSLGGKFIYIAYLDMLTDRDSIELNILSKLMPALNIYSGFFGGTKTDFPAHDGLFGIIKDCGITTADLKEETEFEPIFNSILSGDTAIFIDGYDKAIVVSTKGFPNRGIPKAETEVVVLGSQEAFSEVFRNNTALIRRRIRDTKLKVKQMRIGQKSSTDIALMYLDDLVRPAILADAIKRLENIEIDAILDSGYIEQLIEDDWISPFPQTQITERPDKAASAILEGRIAIIVDNSPFAILIPATLNTFFQSSEDYYQRFHIMAFTRILRYAAGFLAIALPGLYIALTVFHPSMIPMLLVLKMAGSRQLVPFPAVVEMLLMELAFELLREAGIRLPGAVGGAIGIVGGIIVGQAAVEAGIVSPNVVIIVALTGIASFAIPHYSLVSGFRLMKYVVIAFSALLGLLGFWAALIIILIHLASLKSFGIPYLFPYSSGGMNNYSDFKDSLFRMPIFTMKKLPFFANPDSTPRLNGTKTGNKRKRE